MVKLRHHLLRWIGHQAWLPRGRNTLVHKLGRERTSVPFEAPFFGYRYDGDLRNFIDWNVFMYGAYDRAQLKLMSDIVRAGKQLSDRPLVFVDVGANVGHHTLYMSQLVDHVYSFEPWAFVREQLRAKLEVNSVGNVTVCDVALGQHDAELPYLAPVQDHGNLGWGRFVETGRAHEDGVSRMAVRNGDEFFKAAGIPPVALIKIDVEGHEAAVIKGLRRLISTDRPALTIELSDQGVSAFESEKEFRDALYPEHHLWVAKSLRDGYVLEPFRWGPCDNLVVLPRELNLALRAPFEV